MCYHAIYKSKHNRVAFLDIFEVSTLMRKYSSPGSLVAPMIFSAVSPRANPLGLLRVNFSKFQQELGYLI